MGLKVGGFEPILENNPDTLSTDLRKAHTDNLSQARGQMTGFGHANVVNTLESVADAHR